MVHLRYELIVLSSQGHLTSNFSELLFFDIIKCMYFMGLFWLRK